MTERVYASKSGKKEQHLPHGLSRSRRLGSVFPMVVGFACALAVLVIFWLAYTYI